MLDRIAGRYTIENVVGQGGMADVYLARDEILHRQVAIKVLREKLADDPLILVRFTREASAASRLSHPNVVDIYDVGEMNHLHYIVMEYIKGYTLKQLVGYRGALDLREATSIMEQLFSGVAAAHAKGIIHRDIKPQNILVKPDGTVKITDFGIAVANGAVSLTHHNAVMGSAHYLAPESAQGKAPDAKVDIYSLGIVFYELLCGQVPYTGRSAAEIALKHMQQPLPSIRAYNSQIPQSIENIIIKATAKDPAERYDTVQEMALDLKHALDPDRINQPPLKLKTTALSIPTSLEKKRKQELEEESQKQKQEQQAAQTRIQTSGSSSQGSLHTNTRTGSTGMRRVTNKKRKGRKSKKSWITTAVISTISVLAALGLCLVLMATGTIRISGMFGYKTFPQLSGMGYDRALQELENRGFSLAHITTTEQVSDQISEGLVIGADIPAGRVVSQNSPVELYISSGPSFLVEDYTGQYLDDIKARLEAQGVNMVYEIAYQGMPNTNPGIILAQSKLDPGDRIDPDKPQTISFVVSQYPSIILPEDLIGMNIQQAVQWLSEKGIAVYTKDVYGTNQVQYTSPPVGSEYIQEGTDNVVTIYH